MSTQDFYSQGKLLLTGEYVVLDGAEALALPSKPGQSLSVEKTTGNSFQWTSYLKNGELWHESLFTLEDILNKKHKNDFEKRLFEIFKVIYRLRPELFESNYSFTTKLDFEKDWGLGSSSTLINNLSQWADIDPYFLLKNTFGGSGYDIAAAGNKSPFIYSRHEDKIHTRVVELDENLKPHLYFVYLNKKQNSREGIAEYRKKGPDKRLIEEISKISRKLTKTKELKSFENLLRAHESIISEIIGREAIQSRLFSEYKSGVVKSLGAWGGDFVLVTVRQQKDLEYFQNNGYSVIFNYMDLVY